eukprot:COSAG02_NODE_53418_length_302_cov_0.571429_1_plen_68_part_01
MLVPGAGRPGLSLGLMGHEISTQFRFHGAPVNAPVKIYFCIGDSHTVPVALSRYTPVLATAVVLQCNT